MEPKIIGLLSIAWNGIFRTPHKIALATAIVHCIYPMEINFVLQTEKKSAFEIYSLYEEWWVGALNPPNAFFPFMRDGGGGGGRFLLASNT